MLHKVSIAGLTIDPTSNTPIIILKTEEDDQAVPIWIGLLEATSIASVLKNVKFDRPMTHDLFKNFMDTVNVEVAHIEVCDIRENTYFAKIHCKSGDSSFTLDSRPSDAIAIALRFEAPIYVDEKVVEKSKVIDGTADLMDETEEGKKWADSLEKLSDDEFGKYKV